MPPCLYLLLPLLLLLPSCTTSRRLHITSDPSGAIVWLNDQEVGRTPVEVDFTYFGTYDVRLRKEGFEPLVTQAEAKAPLHEQPGIDFLVMMLPGDKRTDIDWHFTLQPESRDTTGLLDRAAELRAQLDSPESEKTGPGASENVSGSDADRASQTDIFDRPL